MSRTSPLLVQTAEPLLTEHEVIEIDRYIHSLEDENERLKERINAEMTLTEFLNTRIDSLDRENARLRGILFEKFRREETRQCADCKDYLPKGAVTQTCQFRDADRQCSNLICGQCIDRQFPLCFTCIDIVWQRGYF